jgi:23S rRNA (adenine2503-C2)-methyltransferase
MQYDDFKAKDFLAAVGLERLQEFMAANGESAYRAGQVQSWISKKWTVDPDAMSNLPAKLKDALKASFLCDTVKTELEETSPEGSRKLLLKLRDGESVECAIIPSPDRFTFCLSTQVGCPVGCAFCASGAAGLVRNLQAGEIVEQFLLATRLCGDLPDNVVIMGVGEPLLNYENLVKALEIICDPNGIALAARRVTISTSGWTPGIKSLAKLGRQWNLALSLHAPDDNVRGMLIPDKFRRPIKEILDACEAHREATGRMLTFEYVLIYGVNDSTEQAANLGKLAKLLRAKVNLIPYNKAFGAFSRPSADTIKRFENTLKSAGVVVTTRVEKGTGANAACGQLRSSASAKKAR